MRNLKMTQVFGALMFAMLCLTSNQIVAQNKIAVSVMQDCCMMKDGKMMQLKDGHLTKMKKPVFLDNGTKIKRNGVCVLPDRTRVRMKEGNCIDLTGKIGDCAAMDKPKTVSMK